MHSGRAGTRAGAGATCEVGAGAIGYVIPAAVTQDSLLGGYYAYALQLSAGTPVAFRGLLGDLGTGTGCTQYTW